MAPTTAMRMPGMRLQRLSTRMVASVAPPTSSVGQCVAPLAAARAGRPSNSPTTPCAVDRKAEELGQLAHQHRQRDAVHVAIADGLGEQFGDEAQARQPGQHAEQPGDERHHAAQRDGALGAAGGQRHDHGGNQRRQRRIRPQHQDAARTEERIGQQRDRSWRRGRRCRGCPTPARRRSPPAPASSSAPARRRDRNAASPAGSAGA